VAELFRRLAVLRQRFFELLFDAHGIGGGARPEFPQRVPIALAPSDQSLMGFPALAEEGDDASASWPRGAASSQSMMRARGPGATHMMIAAARFFAGCWKFNVRCRKFTDGSVVRPFC
jgi:hypothetical protein